MFPLYTSEEMKEQNNKKDINFEGITISISEEKSISKIDSILKVVGYSKLRELIDKYTFL